MQDKKHVLLKIFISTLYLSAFTFGGGYVIVTLMKKKFVDEYHWIDEDEMLDLVAIAQSAPGAIAVNARLSFSGDHESGYLYQECNRRGEEQCRFRDYPCGGDLVRLPSSFGDDVDCQLGYPDFHCRNFQLDVL